jgi:hypothetical protein
MSLITNLIAQQRAVASIHSGNAAAFAGRDQLLSSANNPGTGLQLKPLQQDEFRSTSQIHQGNFNAKFAGKWQESLREKQKKEFETKGLSGFDTFA